MKRQQFIYLLLSILIISLGFLLGRYCFSFNERLDILVFEDNVKQVYRNQDGKVIYPIEKENIIYLPVNGLGSYLDYMTIEDEKGLSLYKVENTDRKILNELNTETIKGEKINSSVFNEADYTVFLLWSTHCKYCKDTIIDFINLNNYINENNIQFYSVVTDIEYLDLKEDILQEDIDNINGIIGDFNIQGTLLVDNVIKNELLSSSNSLPKLIIFDNEGNLIKIIDKTVTSEQFVELFEKIVG